MLSALPSAPAKPWARLSPGARHRKEERKPRDPFYTLRGEARPQGSHLLSRIRHAFGDDGPAKLDREGGAGVQQAQARQEGRQLSSRVHQGQPGAL